MGREIVLVIEREPECRRFLARCLKGAGLHIDVVECEEELCQCVDPSLHTVAIVNYEDPGPFELAELKEVSLRYPSVPLLIVVDHDEALRAVAAMNAGAYGYIGKPYIKDQVILSVRKALERHRLMTEVKDLRVKAAQVERPIICVSEPMRRLVENVDRVARTDATVLIVGESGTGKELVARRIHGKSARAEMPFVAVNCAAMPAELLESELFGHVRGAFTGAGRDRVGKLKAAEAGTLFLDEISGLPLALQGKLLRVLQEREVDVLGSDTPARVDVRIVAATNRDIRGMVAAGEFRADLFYRLNVIEIRVPPLRSRREDIPHLARHFVSRAAGDYSVPIPEDVLDALCRRSWPGNVRELQNACDRLVIIAAGRPMRHSDIPRSRRSRRASGKGRRSVRSAAKVRPLEFPPEGFSLVELERRVIERVLDLKQWNVSETARYLKIPRHILIYRMLKFQLQRQEA